MSFARVRALVVVGVLVVFALIFVVVAIVRDSQSEVTADSCPAGYKLANVTLREEKDVKINVYNGTGRVGLAGDIGDDFKNRKFQVQKVGNDPKKQGVDGVALLRYGPKGVGSMNLLRAYFLDQAEWESGYDANRTDDVVDVVLGGAFQQLATPTEKNQSLGEIGRAPLLPRTCPIEDKDS